MPTSRFTTLKDAGGKELARVQANQVCAVVAKDASKCYLVMQGATVDLAASAESIDQQLAEPDPQ